MQEKSFFQQVAYARRKTKRQKLVKKAEKLCLTPAEYNDLIKPLIMKHKHMTAMLKADKRFWEEQNNQTTAMEVITGERYDEN